jgi:hypothetical protein
MTSLHFAALAALSMPLLAACSGGTGSPSDIEAFNALAAQNNALLAEYAGATPVGSAQLRSSGIAQYQGTIAIAVDTAGPALTQVVGDADITAKFGPGDSGGVVGTYDNFYGYVSGGTTTAWSGSLFSAGVIDRSSPAEGRLIDGTISGTIVSGDSAHSLFVSGPLRGNFLNAPSAAFTPEAVQLESRASTIIRLDGDNYPAVTGAGCTTCISVIAER